MYGTIAKFTMRPGVVDELWAAIDQGEARDMPGFISQMVYQSDTDPNVIWLVVLFKDKETYRANAERPEQDAMYRRLRALLTQDPEWNDGEVVHWSDRVRV